MAGEMTDTLRTELVTRRDRLRSAVEATEDQPQLQALLAEVDAALSRMDSNSYGRCDVCHDPIEPERLVADPLTRHCLDHLSQSEKRALDMDLDLASRIQRTMLPPCRNSYGRWEVCHHFEPAGQVGGDYCDIVVPDGAEGAVYFLLGDVSGKGVAASLLMASLHATFRSLIEGTPAVEVLLERANRLFCQQTMPTHYATLVCCQTTPSHQLRIANAGHPPVLVARPGGVQVIGSTGLPLGMFCNSAYMSRTVTLEPGDVALLYSDGLIETETAAGVDYGLERLKARLTGFTSGGRATAQQVVDACVADLEAHRGSAACADDLTIMAVRRLA